MRVDGPTTQRAGGVVSSPSRPGRWWFQFELRCIVSPRERDWRMRFGVGGNRTASCALKTYLAACCTASYCSQTVFCVHARDSIARAALVLCVRPPEATAAHAASLSAAASRLLAVARNEISRRR